MTSGTEGTPKPCDVEIRDALEAAIELVGKVVTGEVTSDDSGTGLLASYRAQFVDALEALKKR